ncbi:unnamed protein product [Pleuronectes platessa]|uniref:Uncharacterized protein n=1 Tax=Pleuronectes platessa TaxID=8262 RepID=A0A9N7UED3_PLEPL|nr:unnamed protein product [Pleuronectes platessa]
MTERVGGQREEDGTKDGTLRDPSSERTRFRHRSSPSYPVSSVIEVGREQSPRHPGPEGGYQGTWETGGLGVLSSSDRCTLKRRIKELHAAAEKQRKVLDKLEKQKAKQCRKEQEQRRS